MSSYIDHLWVKPTSAFFGTRLSSPARRCHRRKSSKENGYHIAITSLTESAKSVADHLLINFCMFDMVPEDPKEATTIRCKASHIHYVAASQIPYQSQGRFRL